jgi:hypothetical protein
MIYQYFRNMCLIINKIYGSCKMGHHLIPRIVRQHLNQSVGEQCMGSLPYAQSTGLHDLLTSILWIIWMWEYLKGSVYSAPISDLEILQQRVQNSYDSSETRNFWQSAHSENRRASAVDHKNIAKISTGVGFWTYVDWDLFSLLSEYCTHIEPVTLFNIL